MSKFNFVRVYEFCGGFAEFVTLVALFAAIGLAIFSRLTPSFAGAITAVTGTSIFHDQLTQWNNRRDSDDGKKVL
jgi:hypothetical protein